MKRFIKRFQLLFKYKIWKMVEEIEITVGEYAEYQAFAELMMDSEGRIALQDQLKLWRAEHMSYKQRVLGQRTFYKSKDMQLSTFKLYNGK